MPLSFQKLGRQRPFTLDRVKGAYFLAPESKGIYSITFASIIATMAVACLFFFTEHYRR